MTRQSYLSYALILLAAGCYLTSLLLPGIVYHPNHDPSLDPSRLGTVDSGTDILAMGWAGIFVGNIAWYANIVFAVAVVLALDGRMVRTAAVLGLVAFAMGIDALDFTVKPLDESGSHEMLVDRLAIGFYVWETALAIFALSQFIEVMRRRQSAPIPP